MNDVLNHTDCWPIGTLARQRDDCWSLFALSSTLTSSPDICGYFQELSNSYLVALTYNHATLYPVLQNTNDVHMISIRRCWYADGAIICQLHNPSATAPYPSSYLGMATCRSVLHVVHPVVISSLPHWSPFSMSSAISRGMPQCDVLR